MQCVASLELRDGLRVIVDRDHHVPVVQRPVAAVSPKHQQGCRLLASQVATRTLSGVERGHQSFSERCGRLLEGVDHTLHHLTAGEPVSERDAVLTSSASGPTFPLIQIGTCVGGEVTVAIEQRELPLAEVAVATEQHVHGLLW